MLQLLLCTAVMLLFVQAWVWYANYYEGPRTKQQLQQHGPLAGLAAWGFVPIQDACILDDEARQLPLAYLGQLGGFDVEVAFYWRTGWRHRPYYRIRAFFDPGTVAGKKFNEERQQPANHQGCQKACVDALVPISKFGHPNTERLLEAANELIKDVNSRGLAPLGYRRACQWMIEQQHG